MRESERTREGERGVKEREREREGVKERESVSSELGL